MSLFIDDIRSFDNWYRVSARHWVLYKTNSKNSLVLSVFALAGVKSALRFQPSLKNRNTDLSWGINSWSRQYKTWATKRLSLIPESHEFTCGSMSILLLYQVMLLVRYYPLSYLQLPQFFQLSEVE